MIRLILLRFVLALSLLTLPAIAKQPAATPTPAAASSAETLAHDLGNRLDALQDQLDAVRDAHGEPLRHQAMVVHWQGMQEYMAASLKLAVPDPAAVGGSATGCRLVGGKWSGLAFPGQILSHTYLKSMQAHTGRMREELIAVHDARGADALNAALQAHWRSNYQFLQTTRGLGWMFGAWKPAQPGDATLPDPKSEGARLTDTYCSVCHATPYTRLHTAAEWKTVMAKMTQHMAQSDIGVPLCVKMPSGAELDAISSYLDKYAR